VAAVFSMAIAGDWGRRQKDMKLIESTIAQTPRVWRNQILRKFGVIKLSVPGLLEYIALQIEKTKKNDQPLLISIDGVDTSGKTTLSRSLAEFLTERGYSAIQASIDGFHNSAEKKFDFV
jgi:pantothenate kinase-related protein Tda10